MRENMLVPMTENMKKKRMMSDPTLKMFGRITTTESISTLKFREDRTSLKIRMILSALISFKLLKSTESLSSTISAKIEMSATQTMKKSNLFQGLTK